MKLGEQMLHKKLRLRNLINKYNFIKLQIQNLADKISSKALTATIIAKKSVKQAMNMT